MWWWHDTEHIGRGSIGGRWTSKKLWLRGGWVKGGEGGEGGDVERGWVGWDNG